MAQLEFTRAPTFADGVPNVLRGLLAGGCGVGMIVLIFYQCGEARQLDKDGEVGVARVQSVKEHVSRGRRGRVTVTYRASLESPKGVIEVDADGPIPAGANVRYIYSPTLRDGKLIPEGVERGDMLPAALTNWETILLAVVSLGLLWYAYDQWRLVYKVAKKQYVVVPEERNRIQPALKNKAA